MNDCMNSIITDSSIVLLREDIFFKYFYAELWTATGAQYNGLGIMVLTILKIQNLFHKLWDLLELFLAFLVQRVL